MPAMGKRGRAWHQQMGGDPERIVVRAVGGCYDERDCEHPLPRGREEVGGSGREWEGVGGSVREWEGVGRPGPCEFRW